LSFSSLRAAPSFFKMGRASGVISAESKLKNTSRSIAGKSFSSTTSAISCRSSTVICRVFAFCSRFTRSACLASFAAWFGSKERNFVFGWSELTMSPVDGS
jgi:hypothetical protein